MLSCVTGKQIVTIQTEQLDVLVGKAVYFVRVCSGAINPKSVELDVCYGEIEENGMQCVQAAITDLFTPVLAKQVSNCPSHLSPSTPAADCQCLLPITSWLHRCRHTVEMGTDFPGARKRFSGWVAKVWGWAGGCNRQPRERRGAEETCSRICRYGRHQR